MKITLCVVYLDYYSSVGCRSVRFTPTRNKPYNSSDSWFMYYENEDGPGLNHVYYYKKEYELNRLIRFLKTYPEYDQIRYTK